MAVTFLHAGVPYTRLTSIRCLFTPDSAAKTPAYSIGKRDKNATAIGAFPGLRKESKMSSTANTGIERKTDTNGARKRPNEGYRYEMTAKITAKRKEKTKANTARQSVDNSAFQNTPFPNNTPIYFRLSDSGGISKSFPTEW